MSPEAEPTAAALPPPEFSRPIAAETVGRAPERHKIEASAAECAALAVRLGLLALASLSAAVTLTQSRHLLPAAEGGAGRKGGRPRPVAAIALSGTLEARLTQTCVVTLEPFETTLTAPVEALLVPAEALDAAEAALGRTLDLDPGEEGEDPWPEPYEDGRIDLGEIVAQHLSLALDPFPRSPDAPPDASLIESAETGPANPQASAAFARLKDVFGKR